MCFSFLPRHPGQWVMQVSGLFSFSCNEVLTERCSLSIIYSPHQIFCGDMIEKPANCRYARWLVGSFLFKRPYRKIRWIFSIELHMLII